MYFNVLFHPHVFPQMFSYNNFQFLNTCTKRTLNNLTHFFNAFFYPHVYQKHSNNIIQTNQPNRLKVTLNVGFVSLTVKRQFVNIF